MNKICRLLAVISAITIFLVFGNALFANVGVGIMPGIIRVDQPLKPGGQYRLTSMQVVNTGSESGSYQVGVTTLGKQDELTPPADFIMFDPSEPFGLEGGANKVISISLSIPVNAKPGNYLAYVEAHPVANASGGTSIGVSAATKLYFTVASSSTLAGIMNSISNFIDRQAPWSYIIPAVIILGFLVFHMSRKLKFELKLTRK
jgi:hypothetical protein